MSDLVVTFSATGLLLLLASSVIYFIETTAQPEAFSSIPATLWWGVVTLTTVGFGDVYPVMRVLGYEPRFQSTGFNGLGGRYPDFTALNLDVTNIGEVKNPGKIKKRSKRILRVPDTSH